MLTNHRQERRTRRQARFELESLDDRLVLSATATGAAAEAAVAAHANHSALVEQHQEARLARHEAHLARVQSRHEARLARREARFARQHQMPTPAVALQTISLSPMPTVATRAAATHGPTPSPTPASSGTGTTGTMAPLTTTPTPVSTGSTGDNTSPGPLPANVSAPLQTLYSEFQAGNGHVEPSQPSDQMLQISGDSVEIRVKVGSGQDFNAVLSQLESAGMTVDASSSEYGLIDGMMPISALAQAAQVASSVTEVPKPRLQ